MKVKLEYSFIVVVVLLIWVLAETAQAANTISRTPSILARTASAAGAPPAGMVNYFEPFSGVQLVLVPEGCFQMGSPNAEPNRDLDEGPTHQVCVGSFYMGKHEVTNLQYRKKDAAHDSGSYNNLSLNGDWQPVINISWSDANAYAAWLSQKTGMKFRLPTEAEWEYAARAGTVTSRPWGNSPDGACAHANVLDRTSKLVNRAITLDTHNCKDGFAVTAPIGAKQPNKFGLHDMIGNAYEACSDWYQANYYSYSPAKNPQGPGSANAKVLRGGSWNQAPEKVRVANRSSIPPRLRDPLVGFRLVMETGR